MRQIKFRAWDEARKYMMQDVNILGITENFAYGHTRNWIHNCEEWGGEDEFISKPVLMQFTGLTDKNGKEVYEGDILRFNGNENACVSFVVWGLDGWRFNSYMPLGTSRLYPYLASPPSTYSKAEVIGNIHEHPNLLK